MNKKILVVCGNGIASSSIMVSVLEDYLKEQGISGVDVQKSSLMDCPDVTTKVIVGAGLLTGIGEDEIFDAVKEEITK